MSRTTLVDFDLLFNVPRVVVRYLEFALHVLAGHVGRVENDFFVT